MTQNQILLIAIGICLVFFIISLFIHQTEIVLRWILRGAAGGAFIFAINVFLGLLNITSPVGVNGLTMIISSVLGAPGVVALYVVGIYQILS